MQRLEVLIHIITITFDMNQPMHDAMKTANWKRCAATLFDILVRHLGTSFELSVTIFG
jgi:hypothetical protein